MNNLKHIKKCLLTLALAAIAGGFSSCKSSLEEDFTDEGRYAIANEVYGYLRDVNNERTSTALEIHNGESLSQELYLGLTKAADKGIDVTLKIDPEYVATYNKEHATSFELYPATDLVELEEQGAIVVAPGDRRSDVVTVQIDMDERVVEGKTYLLPIAADLKTGGVKLSGDSQRFVFLVRNVGVKPDARKGSIQTICMFEVNDTNPLNALEFNMKNSGKPFFDIIILFAANSKFDQESGRVIVKLNPQVQFLMDNREQYIKPLQDRGMKVLLGILPENGDRAGLGQMADATARDFAQELKAVCAAYKLDGVNFDDEHYGSPVGPGFVPESSAAAARLCYETKRAMPDKIVSVFAYQSMAGFGNVFNGMQPGDYVDFAVPNYGNETSPTHYPGMSMSQCGACSQELRRGTSASEARLREMRANGLGYQMNFSLHPSKYQYGAVYNLQLVAKTLFDDELLFPKYKYDMYTTAKSRL